MKYTRVESTSPPSFQIFQLLTMSVAVETGAFSPTIGSRCLPEEGAQSCAKAKDAPGRQEPTSGACTVKKIQ
jgi:hypothetical protein